MYTESTLKEQCQQILEDNGGKVADKSNRILLEDPALNNLRPPLEFISKNWRDPLTPSMMSLSCEAVGGQSSITHEAALAMSLMSLSFYIWDDIIDKAPFKLFKPTLVGKFGEGTALMIGGLASAKAFSILNQMELDRAKRQTITKLFWNLWTQMAKAETVNLQIRTGNTNPEKKLSVIRMEAAADLGTCLEIGAVLGDGSTEEIKHLREYGLCLGSILELWKDFHVSINLTVELAEKLRSGALPYSLLWAKKHSEKLRKKIGNLNRNIEPSELKEIVNLILEIKTLNHVMNTISKFTRTAKENLNELTKNKATQTLKAFIEAQPKLFSESLTSFKEGRR